MLITKPNMNSSWNGAGIHITIAPPSTMGVIQPAWCNFKHAVKMKVGLKETQCKAWLFQLTRGLLESCETFVLRVEEARARLHLDEETVMLAFEK